jgi:septal ring factor EnvC (AmiA/AmiB activator)
VPTIEEFVDIQALLDATECKAKLEAERLQEWKQIKEMIAAIRTTQLDQRLASKHTETSLNLLTQYLAALARDDKATMRDLARQAKEIAFQVGGIHAGDDADIGADRDIVAGDRG